MNIKGKFFDLYKKNLKRFSKGMGLGKIYPIKKILKSTKEFLKPEYCEVQGHKMYLDKYDSLDLSINGVYGVLETEIIKNEVKEGDIVLDLGANIGYYTLLLARQVGKTGKVFAFEPEPSNFEILTMNVKENNYKNITIVQKAVSNVHKRITLWVGQRSSGANRIYEPKITNTQDFKTIEVDCIKLDDYFKETDLINKICFIKMDIEGAEYKTLLGMQSILHSNPDLIILTEYARTSLEDANDDPEQFLKLFEDEGFRIYLLDEEILKIVPLDKEKFLQSKTEDKTINLLCKKIRDNN